MATCNADASNNHKTKCIGSAIKECTYSSGLGYRWVDADPAGSCECPGGEASCDTWGTNSYDPLVLDLNHNGVIDTVDYLDSEAMFDMNGDGIERFTQFNLYYLA